MPFRPKNSRFWHYDFQIKGRRFHGSCGTEDFEQAKAVEAQARVEARSAATAPAETARYTVSEAIGTYYADVCQHQPSARTSHGQGKAVIENLAPTTQLSALTNSELVRLVARLRASRSNATVNRILQFFGRAVRHMADTYGADVPKLDFKAPETKEPKERIRELSWDEQASLFKVLRTDLHPLVKFALMTGARRASICGLRWRDVDLDNARIRFDVKGDGVMFFPINNEMRAFLTSLPRAELPSEKPFVFTYVDQLRKKRFRINCDGGGIWEEFRAAVTKAGIEDFRFHDLRHTFATRMLRKTGNLKLVSRLLGHADIETTMRYAHVLDGDLHDALADFSAFRAASTRRRKARKG